MNTNRTPLIEEIEALRKQNEELESQVRQRTFELEVLNDLSLQIGYSLNYDDLFRLMLQHLHRIVPYIVSGSFLVLEEPYELFLQYTRPIAPPLLDDIRNRMIATLTRMIGKKLPEGQIRLRTYKAPNTEATRLHVSRLGSVFQVPLIVGPQREVKGMLFVGAEQDGAFSEEHVRILYTVANHAAIAIQQLQALLAAEEQRLESLIQSLPDGIVLLDMHRRVVLINPAAREYLSLLETPLGIGDILTHLAQESLEPLLQPFSVGGHEIEVGTQDPSRWIFELTAQPMTVGPQAGGWTLIIRNITGRKRAEEEIRNLNTELEQRVLERTKQLELANRDLRDEHDLLHSVMENSPVGIMMADRTGRFIFANPKAEYVLGVPKEEIYTRPYTAAAWGITDQDGNLLPDDQLPFQLVLSNGLAIRDVRHSITCPDGNRSLLSINATPMCDENGQVNRVIFSVRDITRRVESEKALRLSEAKLRLITMQMPSILWTTDRDLHMKDILGSSLTRLGYDLDDFIGKSICDLHDMVQPPGAPQSVHQRALRGMSAGYEMTISDREFEVRVDPLRDKEGQIIGCIGLALDITERKQAEEQIRTLNTELEQRVIERTAQLQTANEQTRRMQLFLTSILENIPDVIFAKDAHNFQFVLINKAAEQLLGFPREEVIGKSVADLFPKNIADLFLARDREIVQLGKPMDIPEEVCHLETEENMILHTRLIPVLDEEDQPQYILGISADITEQKKAAQELHQAWETAKAATNAKSEFLANVSHEIRTPLNGIIGMTRLLLDTPLMPEQRDFVETVRISGDALLAIINDVLDFSKIEAGKMELIHHPFNLRECIEESLTLLAAKASEKNLNLAYTIIDGTPLNIVGDMSRLRQILVNLLSNAVKFTEKGEIVIFVESEALWFKDPHLTWGEDHAHPYPLASDEEPEPPSSPWYQFHIAVRDTGIGIPAAYMERLFISFSQVDPTFTRRYGGTGLGLAISKNLAELMQGKMWAESEEGHGSIFHFTFLATLQSSDTESMEVSEHSGETSVSIVNDSSNDEVPLKTDTTLLSPDIAGKRILIVDDNQTNRHIITNQVISWGMLPCVSNSLADARQWIPMKTLFDMVLIDIHLSDTEGLNLVKELRSDSPTHNLAIVMYTSIANRLETAQQANAHVDAFLTRPIKPAQLYDTLIGVLSRHERADVEEEHTTEHSSATPAPSPPHKPHRSTPLPAPHPPNEQLLGKRHPLRILLVEDNVFNQKVALRFLQKLGYEADIVMNGAEALDAIRTHVYDVVLMDVQMPTMDGLDATRIIRTTFPEHQQPWIIAMTAHAMQGDRERCLDVGMNGYVSKPVKLENLIEALNEVKPK